MALEVLLLFDLIFGLYNLRGMAGILSPVHDEGWIPLRMKQYSTVSKAIKRYTSNSAVNCTLLHYYLINLVRNSHV